MRNGRPRVLVLGLGNEILSDDAIGLVVVRELRKIFRDAEGLEFVETHLSGYNLLDFFIGYDAVVVVDSVIVDANEVGSVYFLDARELECRIEAHPHSLGIPEILKLCERAGLEVPRILKIAAIGIRDTELGYGLSPEVEGALPKIVERIRELVESVLSEIRPPDPLGHFSTSRSRR